MRLDTTYLQYITKEEIRVLMAIEMGMKNHEVENIMNQSMSQLTLSKKYLSSKERMHIKSFSNFLRIN